MADPKRRSVQSWQLAVGPITCHAWNKDRSQLAVASSGGNDIHIFEFVKGAWTNTHLLKGHDLPVTGLDWAANTNRIVSASQDKNAFVWTFSGKEWSPKLVLVRLNRAATCVKWSPQENKFAVGSGQRRISVCYYEQENDWWISKQIKKPIQSTVKCIDWHPNNILLAVGACDFYARVFSAYVKEVDEKPLPNPWGSKMPFGSLMTQYKTQGWVHHVAFSPSGCRLAWVCHDATVGLVDANIDSNASHTLRTSGLPYTSITWVSENSCVAAGHDYCSVLLTVQNGQLVHVCKLDVPPIQKETGISSALAMFKSIDKKSDNEARVDTLPTLHQNVITGIQAHSGNAQNILKFSTCGLDGLVALWDLKEVAVK